MNIQKINFSAIKNYNFINQNKKDEPQKEDFQNYQTLPIQTAYNDLTFNARVDKGLKRFYEFNKDRMPITVKTYIENLPDINSRTPLQAQAEAFAALAVAVTIAQVKELFPDEPLFTDLKTVDETNATNGILYTFRENKELLEMFGKSILKNKEDLTLWILKKSLLEGKTLDEINADFRIEANEDFIELNRQHGGSEDVLFPGTIKALGIKNPEMHYVNSLRYTRDGYSDMVGEKISQVQRAIWESLTPEQRTAKAVKTVERFEKWWNSMSRDKQLELIAFQDSELKMLEEFHANAEKNKTPRKSTVKTTETHTTSKVEHEKIETSLSKDDLYKIWARNNLKIAEANLTEQDKEIINNKRMHRRIEIWDSMSPEERTEYIEKMRTGSEVLRYAMIQAWNDNPDIIVELGLHMKKNKIDRPVTMLYGTESISKQMSDVMTNFWELHPDFGERLGESISNAYSIIKSAKNDGKFEQLKNTIMKERAIREKETSYEIKNYKDILPIEELEKYPDYMQDFIIAYKKAPDADYKTLPEDYLKMFFHVTNKNLDEDCIKSWTKVLRKEPLDENDEINIEKIRALESPEIARINRALEATLASVLYKYTNDPIVYMLSNADCKFAMKQIADGNDLIKFYSNKIGEVFELEVNNKNVDTKNINKLYNWYLKPIDNFAVNNILFKFFNWNTKEFDKEYIINTMQAVGDYISLYGYSNEIVFIDGSPYNKAVRKAFTHKFLANMPDNINQEAFSIKYDSPEGYEREDWIRTLITKIRNKYTYLPESILDKYTSANSNVFRDMSLSEIKELEKSFINKNFEHRTIRIPRLNLMPEEILDILCMEQALGDALYNATGNARVYAFSLEDMMDLADKFNSAKKFPNTIYVKDSESGEESDLTAKRKPNYYNVNKIYDDYCNESGEYFNECSEKNEKFDPEEVLYILNPDENKAEIDKYTKIRINSVKGFLVG